MILLINSTINFLNHESQLKLITFTDAHDKMYRYVFACFARRKKMTKELTSPWLVWFSGSKILQDIKLSSNTEKMFSTHIF